MQILKFGGTSVSDATNIRKVRDIVDQRKSEEKAIVVVSAFGGITDRLLQCGIHASENNLDYKLQLQQISQQHLDTIKELLPLTNQSSILSLVMQQFNE